MARKDKKKQRIEGVEIDEKRVLAVFRQGARPMTQADIGRTLRLYKKDRPALRDCLHSLVEKGRLIRTRGAYGLVDKMHLLTGRLEIKRSGVGFVIPEDSRRKDLFISERDLGDAWHGDRVVAAVVREQRNRNHEGRIVRVLERGRQALTARVNRRLGSGAYICRPTDPLLGFGLTLETREKLQPGDVILAAPGEKLEQYLWQAEFLERIGREDDLTVQEALGQGHASGAHGISGRGAR